MVSRGRPTGSQGVKGWAFRVPGDQGVGQQGPMGSRGRPTGSLGVNRLGSDKNTFCKKNGSKALNLTIAICLPI